MSPRGSMFSRIAPIVLFMLLPAVVTAGTCELTIDLSRGDLGLDGSTRGAVTCVELINAIPRADYKVDLKAKECIAAFDSSVFSVGGVGFDSLNRNARVAAEADPCQKAATALSTSLNTATSEADVKKAIATYEETKGEGCDKGKPHIATTKKTVDTSLVIGDNETLTVKVRRPAGDGLEAEEWVHAPSCKGWQMTYGFTFVPNRDRKYFTKANDDGTFTITEQTDREEGDFLASMLFQYYRPDMNHGWAFGLGYDLENISVLAGYGWTYKRNVTLTAGLAIHQRTDLVGRYNVNDILKESIDSAQLVEETFVPNVYVGVAFRFGSNIWSQRNAAQAKVNETRAAELQKQKEQAEERAQEAEDKAEASALKAAQKELCEKQAESGLVSAQKTCDETYATTKAECASETDEVKKTACLESKKTTRDYCMQEAKSKKEEAVAECKVKSLKDQPEEQQQEQEEEQEEEEQEQEEESSDS